MATTVRKLKTREPDIDPRVPRLGFKYVHRTIHGMQDWEFYDACRESMANLLVEGPTGPGKTSSFMGYAESRGLPFLSVPCSVAISTEQLMGSKQFGDSGTFWSDGTITAMFRDGGVLLLNEYNMMLDRLGAILFSVLDNRRELILMDNDNEVVRAHRPTSRDGVTCWCDLDPEDCKQRWLLIAADMNPDYRGTRPLNEANRNRFAVKLWWDYDHEVEKSLIRSSTLLDDIAANIRRQVGSHYTQPVSTNMLQEFEWFAIKFGLDAAIENFSNAFPQAERAAIVNVFGANRSQLETELRLIKIEIDGTDVADAVHAFDLGEEGVDWIQAQED